MRVPDTVTLSREKKVLQLEVVPSRVRVKVFPPGAGLGVTLRVGATTWAWTVAVASPKESRRDRMEGMPGPEKAALGSLREGNMGDTPFDGTGKVAGVICRPRAGDGSHRPRPAGGAGRRPGRA